MNIVTDLCPEFRFGIALRVQRGRLQTETEIDDQIFFDTERPLCTAFMGDGWER